MTASKNQPKIENFCRELFFTFFLLFHCQDSQRELAKVAERHDVWHAAKVMETAEHCHPGKPSFSYLRSKTAAAASEATLPEI